MTFFQYLCLCVIGALSAGIVLILAVTALGWALVRGVDFTDHDCDLGEFPVGTMPPPEEGGNDACRP